MYQSYFLLEWGGLPSDGGTKHIQEYAAQTDDAVREASAILRSSQSQFRVMEKPQTTLFKT